MYKKSVEKLSSHLMRQTDVKEPEAIIGAPVSRHHAVLQLAIAAMVRVRGLEASEHSLAHSGVLGEAEAVGSGQELGAVVIEVRDLHNHRKGPPAACGEDSAGHLDNIRPC